VNLDVGCGGIKKEGFIGLDRYDFLDFYPAGEFIQHDLKDPLPFDDSSIDMIWCHHVLEHLPQLHPNGSIDYLIWVINEFHRVMKVGHEAHLIVPWIEHPNAWRVPSHYRLFNEHSFVWWTYKSGSMGSDILVNGRHGRWGAMRNQVWDETHVYAVLQKLDEYP